MRESTTAGSTPSPNNPTSDTSMNYTSINGGNTNETSTNGTSTNGTNINGTNINGTSINGTNNNGTNINGTSINGTSLNGMNINGTSNRTGRETARKGEGVANGAPALAVTQSYEPIAIVGCAMRLPGGVDSGEALWNLLDGRLDGRCRVPYDRYNVDAFYGPGKQGHVATEFGHFLENIDLAEVDTSFWSMSRKEIEVVDPQQRLALEVAYECLQNAGAKDFRGSNIGVYFGTFGEDWADMQVRETLKSGPYRVTGYGDFVVANRISYELGLKGPSMVIRTACSSSLTGLHEACMAIHRGDCQAAIVGGTNLILNPYMTIAMTEQGVLAPDGQCKTFDANADGYARGEGVVAIMVKKLSDAVRDNDPIRAIVRSSAINSDGRTAGLSLPNSASHEALMRRTHDMAGLPYSQTAMIECHGTGTQVGDPLEVSAVARVFGGHGTYIGSIKPNLGHSEGASGITSVIKAMLALERRLIPPNINFATPNPKIPFDEHKLQVPIRTMLWPENKAERIGVNSFGIGGANAHVLLESAKESGVETKTAVTTHERSHYLLTFSAASKAALHSIVRKHEIYLQQHPERLSDMSYTLNLRREGLAHRAYSVVQTGQEAEALRASTPERIASGSPSVVLVFTGQGAQYAAMGRSLMVSNSTFLRSITNLEHVLAQCGEPPGWSLKDELSKSEKLSRVSLAELSQPLCTAVQIAIVDMLSEWGVKPSAVIGHSSGEIAAAYACGAISAASAIQIAYLRGKAVAMNVSSGGSMVAVGLDRQRVEALLRPGVVIGCENSPSSVTLSGDIDVLEVITADIKARYPDAFVRALKVQCAYHSHHMKCVAPEYAAMLQNLPYGAPTIPFYSSVTGELLESNLDASYWVQNLVSPVLFLSAANKMLEACTTPLILEVGPHSALAGPIRHTVKASATQADYIPTLVRGVDAASCMLECAGSLFQRGYPVNFDVINSAGKVLVDLPTYPWQREGHYWSESRLSSSWRQREFSKHDILGSRVAEVAGGHPTWRNLLRLEDVAWIRDHKIGEDTVFPGAGYIAMAGEAIRQLTGMVDFTVREVNISSALILHEDSAAELLTHLKAVRLTTSLESVWFEFEIYSLSGDRWTKHADGQVRGGQNYDLEVVSQIKPGKRPVDSTAWYTLMRRYGLNYGPRFRGMRNTSADTHQRQAMAVVQDQAQDNESFYALHPATIDQTFQLFSISAYRGLRRLFAQLSVPTYIKELYIKPSLAPINLQADTEVTPRGALFGDCIGITNDPDPEVVFCLKQLKMTPLADASDVRGEDPHAAVDLVWKPNVLFADIGKLGYVKQNYDQLSSAVERLALACIIESDHKLRGRDPVEPHLAKYRDWLSKMHLAASNGLYASVHDNKHIAQMNSTERRALIEDIYEAVKDTEAYPIATAVHRTLEAVENVFIGQTDALQELLRDDILTHVYSFVDRISNLDQFFELASHRKPNLKILEIGAGTGGTTNTILQRISARPPYHVRGYHSYTYTDVSPGFFAAAKERFKAHESIEYKVLDITRDPMEQGFEEKGYDLIVASNVIHATPDLTQTLRGVHRLLAPDGMFFLQELSPATKWINYIMGTLSGWWLGEQDGRQDEPYISPTKWEAHLRAAGFDGIHSLHDDGMFNSTMLAVPRTLGASKGLTVVTDKPEHASIEPLVGHLRQEGHDVTLSLWGNQYPQDQDIVVVVDMHNEDPFVHDMDDYRYQQFKDFIARNASRKILWVTGAAQVKCSNPRYGMLLGLARTIRTEYSAHFATLELDSFSNSSWNAIATVLHSLQREGPREGKPDMEFVLADGAIQVGRFFWTSVNEQLAAGQGEESARKLDIAKRGMLSTLYWRGYSPAEPRGDWVKVRVHAASLNFKDVLISMGIVEGTVVEGDGLGCECAGVVEQVGPDVKQLAPGDRCVVFASGAFSTSLTTNEKICAKLPDDMSFAGAATMPTVYCTVIYGLIHKAQMRPGQTILIHSACGGVGIAAIQLCRYLGIEIYCTVGSAEKATWLMENLQIPKERILRSRDLTFHRDLLRATDNRGVDVVLNSLSGELLHASWQCVAEFGCMVEIGKRDLIGKGTLALDLFERNRTYFGVDFAQICGERPDIASQMLSEMMDLYVKGAIKPIAPITSFGAAQVQEAMRFMQKGSHIGKIVIEFPEDPRTLTTRHQKQAFKLRSDAAYVLVGGLGGLGQSVAVWMAEAGATEIIFLSRSAGDISRYSSFVDELSALGTKATMIAGSVVDRSAVDEALASASKPVRGILQASMVLKDIDFPSMSFSDWQSAVQPKVQGTWNLHHASLGLELDFFLLFSSWSGLVGQWGQANYAAGNAFLDSFVQYRRHQGLPAAAVEIGVMEDIGYVSRNAHVLEHFRTTSTYVIYEQDLLDSFHLMINKSHPLRPGDAQRSATEAIQFVSEGQLGIGLRSTQPLAAPNNRTVWKYDPRMAVYWNMESHSSTSSTGPNEELTQFLVEAQANPNILDKENTAQFLAREIGNTLFGFLMRDPDLLELEASFEALGVDSLVIIELRNWMRQRIGADIPVLEIMGVANLVELGGLAAGRLKNSYTQSERTERDQSGIDGKDYLDTKAP